MRPLIQGREGPPEQTQQAASSPHGRARALHQGRLGQLHEQQREELVGREGIAAPGEVVEEQGTPGDEAAAAAATVGNAATLTELEVTAVAEAAGAVGPEAVAAGATLIRTAIVALQPEELEQAVDPEQTVELALAALPEPVTAAALAAAVTAAAWELDGDLAKEDAPIATASAEMSAAADGASTQGHGQEGSDRRGHGLAASAGAARGKTVKKKLRAQPAPRRPGAGLVPGPPGPLLGWLLQGQLPRGQDQGAAGQRRSWSRGSPLDGRSRLDKASRMPVPEAAQRLAERGEKDEVPAEGEAEEARSLAEGRRS
ncbi:unnamed protein product [Closterium sp. NIES-64]|nr:unnamed protein product [Closterium sp. NIES-64]